MSITNVFNSANKGTFALTPSEFMRSQDKAIEEKRLNLALGLRSF